MLRLISHRSESKRLNKDERTCTYTPVLPTYSFSHNSNKHSIRITLEGLNYIRKRIRSHRNYQQILMSENLT